MILAAALLSRRSNEVSNDNHVLEIFMNLEESDINTPCAISYQRDMGRTYLLRTWVFSRVYPHHHGQRGQLIFSLYD